MSQLDLFGNTPKKLKAVKKLPVCGVQECHEASAYYAPTKLGVWTNMCEKCSREYRNDKFHTGYRLVETSTSQTVFSTFEVNAIGLVAGGLRPRVIGCELCKRHREVEEYFEGVIECAICKAMLRVNRPY